MENSSLNVTKSDEGFDIHQAVEFIEEIKNKIESGDSLTEHEIEEISRIYSRIYFDIIVPIADMLNDIFSEVIDIVTVIIEDERYASLEN